VRDDDSSGIGARCVVGCLVTQQCIKSRVRHACDGVRSGLRQIIPLCRHHDAILVSGRVTKICIGDRIESVRRKNRLWTERLFSEAYDDWFDKAVVTTNSHHVRFH